MRRPITLAIVVLLWASTVRSQIDDEREVDGRRVECWHTGLTGDLKDCGFQSDSYTYVFVGSIAAISPSANGEKKLQIVPEEIYSGNPDSPLTVVTSQAPCLPSMAVGDEWLFYLRKEKDKPIVLDYYGNDSLPAANAKAQIETLRRLKTIGDFGILRGEVRQDDGKAVPRANVIAQLEPNERLYVATADDEGQYEFQPLPPGSYKISVLPIGGLKPDDSEVDIHPGKCWDLALTKSADGEIGGHVRGPDGSPVANEDVVLISSDNESYNTTQTDNDGHFAFEMVGAGNFVVGLNFPARLDWFNGSGGGPGLKLPPASLFYPGVAERSAAGIIRLSADQKIDNIDFVIPTP